MRFFETNRGDDPGFELSPDEVAARFWQSEAGERWRTSEVRLDRTAAGWIAESLGACDMETMDEALDAILKTMPRP